MILFYNQRHQSRRRRWKVHFADRDFAGNLQFLRRKMETREINHPLSNTAQSKARACLSRGGLLHRSFHQRLHGGLQIVLPGRFLCYPDLVRLTRACYHSVQIVRWRHRRKPSLLSVHFPMEGPLPILLQVDHTKAPKVA